jgi:DNA polymerase-4
VRTEASILHLDLDAFFASVEQRDKPSLRGKPVVVGGIGGRGVVATASYEARTYGIRSAMPTAEARRRCPHAAYLTGRFAAYRATSEAVMAELRSLSPVVEPLSLDEAFVDLRGAGLPDLSLPTVTEAARTLRQRIHEVTGGLTGSVGLASSKLMAKIASELDKPDGLAVIEPGSEARVLARMPVAVIPGVGPATTERLRRAGVQTVAELNQLSENELVRLLGEAHGAALFHLARAEDDRPVEPARETKSVSVEDTYDTDLTDPAVIERQIARHARRVALRLRDQALSGRTVTIKARRYDFTTVTRGSTLSEPTDDPETIVRLARSLVADLDVTGGVRLLGVGVSGLSDWVQEDLFWDPDAAETDDDEDTPDPPLARARGLWLPGMDVVHTDHGRGWVWGSGRSVVTVRFETAETGPGPVRSFAVDDPDLRRWESAQLDTE